MSQAEAVSHCAACGQRKAVIDGIATRLGYPDTTVAWIAGAVLFAGTHERKGIGRMHVDAAELCRMLVADFDERDPARIAVRLGDMGLASSRDIGRIVYALIEADLCQAGENDRKDDFDAIFDRVKAAELAYGSAPESADNGRLYDWGGGRGFYFRDPDGILIQLLYHPPISS